MITVECDREFSEPAPQAGNIKVRSLNAFLERHRNPRTRLGTERRRKAVSLPRILRAHYPPHELDLSQVPSAPDANE